MNAALANLIARLVAAAPEPAEAADVAGFASGPTSAAEPALFLVVEFGVLMLALGMALCLYRIVRGPHLADRVLAADAFAMHVVALVILLAIRLRTGIYFDAALVVAILGFASTLAFAQYIGGRRSDLITARAAKVEAARAQAAGHGPEEPA